MNTDSATTFEVCNPFNQEVIERYSYTSAAAAEQALQRAFDLHANRDQWLDAPTRMRVLERLAELVQSRTGSLARQASEEGGKPLRDSMVEITRAVEGIGEAVRQIDRLTGTEVPMGLNEASRHRFAHTFREPRGVVLAISAFNHPFNLIVHQVVTALAAGCPVLIKPALTTPISCIAIVSLLAEAGLPEGWCQLLLTDTAVTEPLVADSRVSFLTFIGSARVGWYLRSKLAAGAICSLEHGGVAPVIVDASADIDASIAPLIRGGFYHAGQVCVSVQRIYLHRSIQDAFVSRFVAAAQRLVSGDQLSADTEVGPLILPREVDRVDEWVQQAVAGGAEVLCGGERISPTVYAPTVLLNPPDDATLSQQEIFGPVVSLYGYDEIDEAVARANGPDTFFQAALFTRDLDTALSVSRRMNGMAVMVNDHSAFRVDWMPFGGHRQSGMGVGGIGHTMREMTVERMVVFHADGLSK